MDEDTHEGAEPHELTEHSTHEEVLKVLKECFEEMGQTDAMIFVLGMEYAEAMFTRHAEGLPPNSERLKAFTAALAKLQGERRRLTGAKAGGLLPSGMVGKVDTKRLPGEPDAWQISRD